MGAPPAMISTGYGPCTALIASPPSLWSARTSMAPQRLFSDAARVDTRRNSRILSSLPMLFPNPPQSRRYYRTSRTAQSATIQNGGSLTTSGECGFSSGKFDVSLTFPSGSRLRAHTFQSRHCCFGTVSRVELRFLACGHAGPRAFPHLGIVMVPNISLKHGFTIVTT